VTAESTSHSDTINFIERWASSGTAERANYQIFLAELCDVLEVSRPEPTKPDEDENAYVFEKAVTFHHGDGTSSTGPRDASTFTSAGASFWKRSREASSIINPNRS
jgi:hypothetical protein